MPSSTAGPGPRRRRWGLIWTVVIVAALCAIFPPVRFHAQGKSAGPASAGTTLPAGPQAPGKLWDEQLIPAARQGNDLKTVLEAISTDARAAGSKFGRTPVIGGPTYLLVSGNGKIVEKKSGEIVIGLTDNPTKTVVIRTGPLFGNAIRDGSGVIDAKQYANSGEFNALSSELNRLAKTRVISELREKAKIGDRIAFGGVAEIPDGETRPLPLTVVPIYAELN